MYKHKNKNKQTFGPKFNLKIPPYVRKSSYKGMKKASLRMALITPFASGIFGQSSWASTQLNKNSRISLGTPNFDKLFFAPDGKLISKTEDKK